METPRHCRKLLLLLGPVHFFDFFFLYSLATLTVYVNALALTLVPVFRESDTRGWRHKRCRTAQLPDKPTETLSVSVDIDGSIKETVSEKC